jgi:hypothetical protein
MIKPIKPFIPLIPLVEKGFLKIEEENLLEIDQDGVLAVNSNAKDKFFHFILSDENAEYAYSFDCIQPTFLEMVNEQSSILKVPDTTPITLSELPVWKIPDAYAEKFLIGVDIETNKVFKVPFDVIFGFAEKETCFPKEEQFNNIFFSDKEKIDIDENGKITRTPLKNINIQAIDDMIEILQGLNKKLTNFNQNFDVFL